MIWNIVSVLFPPIGIARMIGWTVRFICKKLILPSAWFYPNQILQRAKTVFKLSCQNLQKQFEIRKDKILTPDGVKLNTIYFRHRKADEKTKTILFYQSNASISQLGIYLWLIEEAIRRKSVCNFVVFDYRGVGSSQGDAQSTNDLLIDGDTALQFVIDYLKVPPHSIGFYTWSLGGAIGTIIKSLYPECTGPLINERSFFSLKVLLEKMIPSFLFPFFFWIPWTVEQEGWKLEVPLQKVKGKTMVIYHPEDQTTPLEASAYKAAKKWELSIEAIQLEQTEEEIKRAEGKIVDHHFEDLKNYQTASGKKADQLAAEFILNDSHYQSPIYNRI